MSQTTLNFGIDKDLKIEVNPFYSEENMTHLRKAVKDLKNGKGVEHELIEVEE